MKCKICDFKTKNKKSFATHLQMKHKITSKEYTIKFILNGQQPTCPICNGETRYVSFGFKKYCKEHSHYAEAEGGREGGKAKAWNKGRTKKNDKRILQQSERVMGENNHFYGRKHTPESIEKMKQGCKISQAEYSERLMSRNHEFYVLTLYENYLSRQHQYLEMECIVCGTKQKKTLQAFERGSLCTKCNPYTSQAEVEIADFVESLGFYVDRRIRSIIGKELDVYVPKKGIAIEYNGLYWHQDDGKEAAFDKRSHKNKTQDCLEKGIRLIHIFSDEWDEKKEIVKSMICNRLGIADRKIGARQCKVKKITSKQTKEFFEETHISGSVKASFSFGLFFKEELVCALSLRKPHHKKHKNKLEIARLSTAKNTVVMGGFSKLFKRVLKTAKKEKVEAIISYADLRFGEGLVYAKNGFSLISDTGLNFWYTNRISRYDRFRYRAQNGKSEAEVARENGVYRVYGCGNNLYEYKLIE